MDLIGSVNHILNFILLLYSDPLLPRRIVETVISYIKDFTSNLILASLKKDIMEVLERNKVPTLVSKEIIYCIDSYDNIFTYIDTEDKRRKDFHRKHVRGWVVE